MSNRRPSSPPWKSHRPVAAGRGTRNSVVSLGNLSKDQREAQLVPVQRNNAAESAVMPELNLDETMHVRGVFSELVREECITTKFELRVVLSQLGMYPSDEELDLLLSAFENKVSIHNLCHYLRFYKWEFQISAQQRRAGKPEGSSQDETEDTLRAFVSLGGSEDGTGSVKLEDLRHICHEFGLTIDIDSMLSDVVDIENQTTLSYAEFCEMWRSKLPRRNRASSTCTLESQFDICNSMRSLRMSTSSRLRTVGSRSEVASAVGREEGVADGYKFPQMEAGTAAAPSREQVRLQALRRFLLPGVSPDPATGDSPMRRKPPRGCTMQLPHTTTAADVERRRSHSAVREEGGNNATAGDSDDVTLPPLTGGYRAPSPMILSLRNSAAYKRRLQAFVRKSKMKARGRNSSIWTSFPSLVADDEGVHN